MLKTDNTKKRVKFTAGVVRAFTCDQNRTEQLLWDTDEKTLCIRARKSGGRSYYYQSRLNGKVIKLRIGSLSNTELTHEVARVEARKYQSMVDSGKDPRLEIKRSLLSEAAEQVEIAKKGVKFQQVLDDYIAANMSEWGKSHYNDYLKSTQITQRGRNGILYAFKGVTLEDLDSEFLLAWVKLEKKHRPTATAKGYRLLRACLNWANTQPKYKDTIELDQLFNNTEIRKAIPKPKARKDSLDSLHLPLWFESVKAIDNPVIAACLQTLLLTGARREEVLSLKWSDVDFQWFSLTIKDKIEGRRTIPLTPYVAQLLHDLPRRNKWVFSSPTSDSGRLVEPYIAHAKALELGGLPKLSIHGLRRSFGSLSEWVECPVGIVAQIQGHKPSATAEKHYRVRPLDLLRLWHTKIEKQILNFGGLEQPADFSEELRAVV